MIRKIAGGKKFRLYSRKKNPKTGKTTESRDIFHLRAAARRNMSGRCSILSGINSSAAKD